MSFHDVIRALADAGPWASDAERAAARAAVDEHERWHAAEHGLPPPATPVPAPADAAVPVPPIEDCAKAALDLLQQAAAAMGMTVQPAPPPDPPAPR